MKTRRYLLACAVLFVLALAWGAVVHLVLLRDVHATVEHLRRPDFAAKAWLSLPLTAGFVGLFVWGYGRFARDGSVRDGALYGLFVAILAGLLVDLNQYLLYPIPAWVATVWFVSGVAEFVLYGVVVSRLLAARTST